MSQSLYHAAALQLSVVSVALSAVIKRTARVSQRSSTERGELHPAVPSPPTP